MPKKVVDQNLVLRTLVEVATPLAPDAISRFALAKPAPVGSPLRRSIIQALGALMERRLVERAAIVRGKAFAEPGRIVTYQATAEGRKFAAAGKTITSGARGPRTGLPEKSAGMRQRLWDGLRILQRVTVADLVEAARRDGDPSAVKVTDNARKYLTALARAGIVKRLSRREPGAAPSSNGFMRFALLRDLGPTAPLTGKSFVTDPNARARIPYAVESLPPASRRKAS